MKHLSACRLILFLTLSLLAGSVFTARADDGVTLKMSAPVSKVLDAVEAQTGYLFVTADIDLSRKVTVDVTDQSLENVLRILFDGTDIEWKISGVNVTLSRKSASQPAQAAAKVLSISGTVTDASGIPVPGAAVLVNGNTANAAITDVDGKYSLSASKGDYLLFNCLGFKEQRVEVVGAVVVDVVLEEEANILDETVVVGYRTVKKISMTGSVASIDIKRKENQPISNTTQMLYSTPGVFVNQGGAKPGADAASITIRGVNSLNTTGGAPLVLLDGVEYDISSIDPAVIESITVLKDVSAAIYGLKAANGVILITSKKGVKGKPKVELRTSFGIQDITQIPDVVTDPILYMRMRNLAEVNSGVSPSAVTYSQAAIDEYQAGLGTDPILYPASDWYDICLGKGNIQQHNVRVSGGTDALTYSIGGGYMRQKGVMIGDEYANRFSYDLKVNARITKWMNIRAAYQGASRTVFTPGYGTQANLKTLSRAIPIFADFYQDGLWYTTWLSTPGRNHPEIPTMYLTEGYTKQKYQDNLVMVGTDLKLPFGITYVANFNYRKRDTFTKVFRPSYYGVNPKTGEVDTGYVTAVTSPFVTDTDNWYNQSLFSQNLSWTKDFGRHDVHLMIGQEWQHVASSSFSAGNKDFNDNTLQELDAKGSDYTYATVSGSSSEAALISFFGRAAYTYDDRYMLEVTARYDGSSKLSRENRWHVFPSVSAAWNIHKENWFNAPAVDCLKLRASYGIMGSESVSNYSYYMTVKAFTDNYSFGGQSATGYGVSTLTDTTLGWEKTESIDLGVDFMAFDNRLNFEVDGFYKRTFDILMTRSIPAHLGGLKGPSSNVGTVRNVGMETSLSWKDSIGQDFHYGINGSFTFVRNRVMDINAGTIFQNNNTIITKEGYPIRSFYLLEADGFFDSYEEINEADAVYGDRGALRPGYVRYVDQNDDGVIDNNDKIITKNSIPEITYSFGFNLGWKGISLDAQFQGIGDCYVYLTGNIVLPFNNGAGVTRDWATDSWTYRTKDTATLPILTTATDAPMNFQPSTLWLRDCRYLRLKNLQLSYSFPERLLSRIRMSKLQIYCSGQNLWTLTPFRIWDPEVTSTSAELYFEYPNLRTYSFGLNITF